MTFIMTFYLTGLIAEPVISNGFAKSEIVGCLHSIKTWYENLTTTNCVPKIIFPQLNAGNIFLQLQNFTAPDNGWSTMGRT